MVLPRLTRKVLTSAEVEDPIIWQPGWKCFCCHDSGWVRHPHLVIPDYDNNQDMNIVCQAPKCQASQQLLSSQLILDNPESFDFRFTPKICQEIDQLMREDFRQTAATKAAKKLKEQVEQEQGLLAKKMNLRSRDRDNEEIEYAARNLIAAKFQLEKPVDDKEEEDADFLDSCR